MSQSGGGLGRGSGRRETEPPGMPPRLNLQPPSTGRGHGIGRGQPRAEPPAMPQRLNLHPPSAGRGGSRGREQQEAEPPVIPPRLNLQPPSAGRGDSRGRGQPRAEPPAMPQRLNLHPPSAGRGGSRGREQQEAEPPVIPPRLNLQPPPAGRGDSRGREQQKTEHPAMPPRSNLRLPSAGRGGSRGREQQEAEPPAMPPRLNLQPPSAGRGGGLSRVKQEAEPPAMPPRLNLQPPSAGRGGGLSRVKQETEPPSMPPRLNPRPSSAGVASTSSARPLATANAGEASKSSAMPLAMYYASEASASSARPRAKAYAREASTSPARPRTTAYAGEASTSSARPKATAYAGEEATTSSARPRPVQAAAAGASAPSSRAPPRGGKASKKIVPPPLPPTTILRLQSRHRSELIRQGLKPPVLVNRQAQHNQIDLDDRCLEFLKQADLDALALIPPIQIDAALITALVERWRPETHTFHFSVGEMTVTLQDVAVLYGLKIEGVPLKMKKRELPWAVVLEEMLGVEPPENKLQGNNLNRKWLADQFTELPPDDADDEEVARHTRAWLMYHFGAVIFPDTCSDTVPLPFLAWISNFREARKYNWGAAVLAWLHHSLCKASLDNIRQIGGPLLLLQLWAWLRLPIAKPLLKPFDKQQEISMEGLPLACYWSKYQRTWVDGNRRNPKIYRDEMDHFNDLSIKWKPYTKERLKGLHRFSVAVRWDQWLQPGPLIFATVVEPYCPHRVMRQFGLHQTFPPPEFAIDDVLHEHRFRLCKGKSQRWKDEYERQCSRSVARPLRAARRHRLYDHSTYDDYLTWFSRVSLLRINPQPLVAPIDPDCTVLPKTYITAPMANKLMEILEMQRSCLKGHVSLQDLANFTLQKVRSVFKESGLKGHALSLPDTMTPDYEVKIEQHMVQSKKPAQAKKRPASQMFDRMEKEEEEPGVNGRQSTLKKPRNGIVING